MKGFDKAQRAYDAMVPDDMEVDECPVCGDLLENDGVGGWRCINKECGWSIDAGDPGYDSILKEV
jgi:hypothetical protein